MTTSKATQVNVPLGHQDSITSYDIITGINNTIVLSFYSDIYNITIENIYVKEFPTEGKIYQSANGSFKKQILYVDGTDTLLENLSIGYEYTDSEVPTESNGLITSDWFVLETNTMNISNSTLMMKDDVVIKINIFTSIFARPSSNYEDIMILEDEISKEISLHGEDISLLKRKLQYQIKSIPNYGALQDSQSLNGVSTDSIVSEVDNFPYKKGVKIRYENLPHNFTLPATMANGTNLDVSDISFEYVAFIYNEYNMTYKHSYPVTQRILVRNVNDKPMLLLPQGDISVHTFSPFTWRKDLCKFPTEIESQNNITNSTLSDDKCDSRAFITGIKIIDHDKNVDKVRIDVSCKKGYISVYPEYRKLAEFSTCSERPNLKWNCTGSGIGDRQMTFIALPDDVNLILSIISYETFETGNDEITVTIYDGIHENCLENSEHRPIDYLNPITTLHRECFKVSGKIPITILSTDKEDFLDKLKEIDIPSQLWVGFYITVAVLLFVLYSCVYNYFYSLSKKEGKELSNQNEKNQHGHNNCVENTLLTNNTSSQKSLSNVAKNEQNLKDGYNQIYDNDTLNVMKWNTNNGNNEVKDRPYHYEYKEKETSWTNIWEYEHDENDNCRSPEPSENERLSNLSCINLSDPDLDESLEVEDEGKRRNPLLLPRPNNRKDCIGKRFSIC